MPARAKVLRNGTIGGEEPLRLSWGLEPLHAPLALPGGLGGVLRPIVERAVLTMVHPWEDLPLGGSIALEFVGNNHARYVGQSLEQLAEELLGRLLVPAALHEDF
jgi:hypothetical protein